VIFCTFGGERNSVGSVANWRGAWQDQADASRTRGLFVRPAASPYRAWAQRKRAEAEETRRVAALTSLRTDRERLLERAKEMLLDAEHLEQQARIETAWLRYCK